MEHNWQYHLNDKKQDDDLIVRKKTEEFPPKK